MDGWDPLANLLVAPSGELEWTGDAIDAHPVRTTIFQTHVEFGIRLPEADNAYFLKLELER